MAAVSLNVISALLAVLVAYAIGSRAGPIGRKLGLLDFPDPYGGRKRHQHVTPLVGGLAVVLAFELAAAMLIVMLGDDSAVFDWQVAWIAGAVGVMSIIGLLDDRLGLSPMLRLSVTTLVLTLTVLYAPDFRVEFLRFTGVGELTILPAWAAVLFTLFCLIGLLNAVNMADGKNGVVITLGLIWSGVLFVRNPQPFDPLLFAAAGSLAVLLAFNMKGLLFLGDGGSYGLSAMFGLLAIYAYNHGFSRFGAEQVAIMFLVPVLDTVRLMTWRVRHGRSPFMGDRNHLHHYLHARWDWPAGLFAYAALVAIPNVLAATLPDLSLAWLGLGIFLYGMTLWFAARGGTFREGFTA